MIVECVKIIDKVSGELQTTSHWLTIGKRYTVLTVGNHAGRGLLFRVMSDDGFTPIVADWHEFKVLSSRLPSTWVGSLDKNGDLMLAPNAWTRPGFWEDYFDREPEAMKQFDQARQVIEAEAGEFEEAILPRMQS